MNRPPRAQLIAAFAVLYVIWGSTYLGIRFAIESVPPFLMGGTRFLLAGAILFVVARWRGAAWPTSADWRTAFIVGACLLLCGNGGLAFAEQYIPSSLAALLVATVPLFMALLGWFAGITGRPTPKVWFGFTLGFAGTFLLVQRRAGDVHAFSSTPGLGIGVVLFSAFVWSIGSLYARKTRSATSPFMAAALQMVCGGALLTLLALGTGEASRFNPAAVTTRSLLAYAYLVLIGSLLAFTAYIWLLQICDPAKVATYAYVNPVVAIFLGWSLGGERVTSQMLLGAGLIVPAVVLVISSRTGENRRAAAGLPAECATSQPT
ncbi:MAG: multidrug transporter [Verrucomicrobia bacterium]|nr:MAG: multidrug transporter [Verrucomicrobiota bacterium]